MKLPIGPRPGTVTHEGPKRMYSGVSVSVGEFAPPVMQMNCLPSGTSLSGVNLPSWIVTVDAQMYLPDTAVFVVPFGPDGSLCCLVQSIGGMKPSASNAVSELRESITFCCENSGPASLRPCTSWS